MTQQQLKTSLGIWALGPMITRFVPVGYQPQWTSEPIVDKVKRAVSGLGDLIDDYEFHYPYEINEDNAEAIKAALGGHGIYCVATGLHLDPLFGRGGLCSPDASVRKEAVRRTLAAADMAGKLSFEKHLLPGGKTKTSKEDWPSVTVARDSGIRGRSAGKARAHDHWKSKEISPRQSMQISERRDLVREVLSRSRRSTKTCPTRSSFRDGREASTHGVGRHCCCTQQEPGARAGSRTGAKVRGTGVHSAEIRKRRLA